MSGPIFEIGIIALLIILNGLFAASEMALVTIRRSRLNQLVDEGRAGAARILHLKTDPGRFLAVIQIGITFIGFLAAACPWPTAWRRPSWASPSWSPTPAPSPCSS
jgi:putative hemolysin